ncbi:ABC transporter permease [Lichenifustis flavocetrariae]|uniref:ABC transporter permease n=1 Tax=Lichenifustis flavocetrariae TaxID=2949735 RepID=A0AA41YV68_9HYPH|nr:ABC transporter permease [Lichenifustis flavocetrariae]MCW6507811.1 ABC transporter permease [Lichenifustis flavocetrariae]
MRISPYATLPQKVGVWTIRLFALLMCLYLAGPIVVFIPLSFSDKALFHYPIQSFSLRWYHQLVTSPEWLRAVLNSLAVATSASVLATILGVAAAFGLWRARFRGKEAVMMVIMTPMIVPAVISGVSMYLALAKVGLGNTHLGLILAHTALAAPLVVITVSATLSKFDTTLLRAAANLGANPLTAFRRVCLPVIASGVFTGAIFAFALSFDDVVVALFIAGPAQRTLPVQMYMQANDLVDLTITAAATVMLVLSLALMVGVEFMKKREVATAR